VTTDSKTPAIGVAGSATETMISVASHRDTTWIPIRAITRVDVSTARKRPTWSKTAPLWLAGAGAVTGAALASALDKGDSEPAYGPSSEAAGAILGGLVGLIAGIVVAVEVVHETWEPVVGGVSSRSSVAPDLYVAPRRSGLSVGLHASF